MHIMDCNFSLTSLIQGRASKRVEGFYLGWTILNFFGISWLAQLTYPEPYSPLFHNISHLGGFVHNPEGALLWNIGMVVVGILLLPHQLYLHKHLKTSFPGNNPSTQKVLKVGLGCRVIACLGIIFIAILPEDLGIWHMIPAFGVFFGFLIAFNLDFGLLWQYSPRLRSRKGILLWLIIGWMDFTFLGLVVTQLFPALLAQWGIPVIILELSPWEWSLFVSYFGWMGGLHILLEKISKRRN